MISMMLEIVFKSSVILIVTFIASLFAQKQSAAFRHWIWTAGLLSALTAPILGMYLPAWHPQIATFAVNSVQRLTPVASPAKIEGLRAAEGPVEGQPHSGILSQTRGSGLSLQWALAIWTFGVGIAGVLLLVEIFKLMRVVWHATPVHHRPWCDLAGDISSSLRLKRSVKLLWNPNSSVLGTWGTFHPRILLPREIENWPEERMRVVLAHELSHVKRNDWLVQLLAEAGRVLYWFNPLFWIACARLRRESEFACDDAALNLGIDGPIYAGHLLDLVRTLKRSGKLRTAALAMAGVSNLERRLVAMLNPSMNRRSVGKGTIAAIACLACALTLPIAAMEAEKSVPVVITTRPPVPLPMVAVHPPVLQESPAIPPKAQPAIGSTERKDQIAHAPVQQPLVAVPVPPQAKPPATVAMVFVVDVSGSMSQGQLTIAKEAAKASLKALRDSDRFGTLAFNTTSNWVAPLQAAGNRDAINAQIDTMFASGGTNIYVGLNGAYDALRDAKEDVKVVIVLSDGITQSADFQSLATNMHNAGISISSISVGLAANRTLMADLALWGKGRAYYVQTYDRVPQILIRETELAVIRTQ